MVQGNQPVRVSNTSVEQAIRASTDATGISMWSYQVEGHEFVGLEIPGYEKTWVYDAAVGEWHERGYWARYDAETGVYHATGRPVVSGWSPMGFRFVTYFAVEDDPGTPGTSVTGTHWAGDSDFSALYILDSSRNTLGTTTAPIVRERTWPHIVKDGLEPTSFRGLELSMKTGPETAGAVTLEISNDGGASFGPPLPRALGATGRRMERIRWLNLGTAINRVFRIRCSSVDVPFAIYSAAVDT
jgi:hypothetical protein